MIERSLILCPNFLEFPHMCVFVCNQDTDNNNNIIIIIIIIIICKKFCKIWK